MGSGNSVSLRQGEYRENYAPRLSRVKWPETKGKEKKNLKGSQRGENICDLQTNNKKISSWLLMRNDRSHKTM